VNALRNVLDALVPGGTLLDLQTMRPPPSVEAQGRVVCELETASFFVQADANDLVLMDAVQKGVLALEAEESLEVLQRWSSGAELVADLESRRRKVPAAMRPIVEAIDAECIVREPCRLRRLSVSPRARR